VLGIPLVAVILAVVLRWSTPMGGLVPYELEIIAPKAPAGGVTRTDGTTALRIALERSQPVTLLLRPEHEFKDAVESRAFVESQPGSMRRDPVPFGVEAVPASVGALRLTLDTHQLPARGRITVLIGRPGSIPAIPAGTADHGRNWQRFEIDFDSI
jgi:hypothetical protein